MFRQIIYNEHKHQVTSVNYKSEQIAELFEWP